MQRKLVLARGSDWEERTQRQAPKRLAKSRLSRGPPYAATGLCPRVGRAAYISGPRPIFRSIRKEAAVVGTAER